MSECVFGNCKHIADLEEEVRVCNEARIQAERDMFSALDSDAAVSTLRRELHKQDDNVQRLERELTACRAELAATKLVLAQNGKDADALAKQLDAVTRENDALKAYRDSVVGVVPATCDKIMTQLGDLRKMIDDQQARLAASESARATAERTVERLREALMAVWEEVGNSETELTSVCKDRVKAALAVGGENGPRQEARVCDNCRHRSVWRSNEPCVSCSIPERGDRFEAPVTSAGGWREGEGK